MIGNYILLLLVMYCVDYIFKFSSAIFVHVSKKDMLFMRRKILDSRSIKASQYIEESPDSLVVGAR